MCNIFVCVCVCMCVRVLTRARVCVCMCVYVCVRAHTFIVMCLSTHAYAQWNVCKLGRCPARNVIHYYSRLLDDLKVLIIKAVRGFNLRKRIPCLFNLVPS